jgi:hypothetical protein
MFFHFGFGFVFVISVAWLCLMIIFLSLFYRSSSPPLFFLFEISCDHCGVHVDLGFLKKKGTKLKGSWENTVHSLG